MSEATAAGKGGERERAREREMRGGRLRGGRAPRGEGGGVLREIDCGRFFAKSAANSNFLFFALKFSEWQGVFR